MRVDFNFLLVDITARITDYISLWENLAEQYNNEVILIRLDKKGDFTLKLVFPLIEPRTKQKHSF
jgi:hypothetical protein